MRDMWYELANKLNHVRLEKGRDQAVWKWTVSGRFSVKSAYNQLTKNDDGPSFRVIWKAKLPEKIAQRAIVTKDNMIRKKLSWGSKLLFLWGF
jgi:hypothetical protein